MSECGDFCKRALPHGTQIVLEVDADNWVGALYAGGRCVSWRGDDPENALADLTHKWMVETRRDECEAKGQDR